MKLIARYSLPPILAIPIIAVAAMLPKIAFGGEVTAFIPDMIISSTVPDNGDLNPYGVAFVPSGFPSGGKIASGDILVSNFNNAGTSDNPGGIQGTGTTIIKLTPNDAVAPPGKASTFFTSPAVGLTTALGVFQSGFVLVGNLPNSGTQLGAGSLQLIDRHGILVQAITGNLIDGPWDLTIDDYSDHATVFVSNVLSGNVVRISFAFGSKGVTVGPPTVIANGYTVMRNDAALILGPTGLAHDKSTDTLYVASTADNKIFAVPNAGTRSVPPPGKGTGMAIFDNEHLRGPLALALAPNGDLVTSNGDAVNPDPTQPSEIVEFTKTGKFVAQFNVDAAQGGAFGLAIARLGFDAARLAAVDDNANDLIVVDRDTSLSE